MQRTHSFYMHGIVQIVVDGDVASESHNWPNRKRAHDEWPLAAIKWKIYNVNINLRRCRVMQMHKMRNEKCNTQRAAGRRRSMEKS